MQINEFRAFVTIAESGRMDTAAKALGYSQPAISYQIKCLERALQMKLFDRTSVGVRLTREGETVLPSIRSVLAIVDSIKTGDEDGPSQPDGMDGIEWASRQIQRQMKNTL
jgi:DNA-binding transcriptional LysR family regulator